MSAATPDRRTRRRAAGESVVGKATLRRVGPLSVSHRAPDHPMRLVTRVAEARRRRLAQRSCARLSTSIPTSAALADWGLERTDSKAERVPGLRRPRPVPNAAHAVRLPRREAGGGRQWELTAACRLDRCCRKPV